MAWTIARTMPALHPHRGMMHDIHDEKGRPVASAVGEAGSLVAAAPEMLAALKAVAPLLKRFGEASSDEGALLLNAIAKAEGEL